MRRWLFAVSTLIGTTALAIACGAGTDCDFGLCEGPIVGGEAGSDGLVPVDATAPGCDPTKEQKDQEACLNDDFAVFVALTGKPDAAGTKASPVNTVARALELATGTKQRVFVCEGTYDERVILKSATSIYGGLSCTANVWKGPGARAVFRKVQEPGYALDIFKIAGGFELADLEFVAAPGTSEAPNSIAARVVNSPGAAFKRVALTAGDGAQGAAGEEGKTGDRTPLDGKGGPGTGGTGGTANACTCSVGGPTSGGGGGGALNGGGAPGTGDAPAVGSTDGAGGGGASVNCALGLGHEGAAAAAQPPAPAATKFGGVVADQWAPAEGTAGTAGGSGQGGGGGGANNGGGGAGGCGGCGGSGGKGGKGGGASVALLALQSPIKLAGCTLATSKGGKGGKGGLGGSGGTPGGSGGGGTAAPNNGCAGGPGGRGGDGGHGSGGPGGVAIGILFLGTAPVQGGTMINQNGPGGPGGDPAAAGANAGPDGKKSTTMDGLAL